MSRQDLMKRGHRRYVRNLKVLVKILSGFTRVLVAERGRSPELRSSTASLVIMTVEQVCLGIVGCWTKVSVHMEIITFYRLEETSGTLRLVMRIDAARAKFSAIINQRSAIKVAALGGGSMLKSGRITRSTELLQLTKFRPAPPT